MAELTRYAATTEPMRDKAIDIVQGVYASGPGDYVRAVYHYVRRFIVLVHEPDEILIDPLKMLDDIRRGRAYGDCDDAAMLAAALVSALGIAARFKAVFPAAAGHYQHVFMEYSFGPGLPWMPLDVTIDGTPEYPPDWLTVDI